MFSMRKYLVLAIFTCFTYCNAVITTTAHGASHAPFKLDSAHDYTISLNDKGGKVVKAKVVFQKYIPTFKVNKTFGFQWNDLDFSIIEHVLIGSIAFKTRSQYISLHHGEVRKHREAFYNDEKWEESARKLKETPLDKRYSSYYSKCLLNALGDEYYLIKRTLHSPDRKYAGVKLFYLDEDNKWKNSNRVMKEFPKSAVKLFRAYKDKSADDFLVWLASEQKKAIKIASVSAEQKKYQGHPVDALALMRLKDASFHIYAPLFKAKGIYNNLKDAKCLTPEELVLSIESEKTQEWVDHNYLPGKSHSVSKKAFENRNKKDKEKKPS